MSSKPAGRKAGPKAGKATRAPARKRPQPRIDAGRADLFLQHLAVTGSVTIAAERAGVARSAVYARRERNKTFRDAWQRAVDLGVEHLHDRAMERALEGEERPVIRDGEQVATVRHYDNRLLLSLLRAHRPGFGGDRQAASNDRSVDLLRRLKAAEKRLANHRSERSRRKRRADAHKASSGGGESDAG